jgi:hypothetical protein
MQVQAKEDVIDGILTETAERAPWVIAGYDDELRSVWQSERQEFIAAVDERRKAPAEPVE